jgi:hypothetical protein
MRDTIDTLRYRWLGTSSGGVSVLLSWRSVAGALPILVVFACFFAVGRATRSAVAPAGATTAAQLEAAASTAPIPVGLSGGPPVAGAVPAAILLKPRPPAPRRAASPAPVQPSVTTTPAQPTAVVPEPATTPAVAPTPVQPKPAPRPEPTKPSPAVASPPSGSPTKAASGSGGKSTGGGGSFDTSE